MMRLVADQQVELHAPVAAVLAGIHGGQPLAAAQITVLNLLNHTAGLDWGPPDGPDESDDALARYVAALRDQQLIAAPGTNACRGQARRGYNVAGRIIEVGDDQHHLRAGGHKLGCPGAVGPGTTALLRPQYKRSPVQCRWGTNLSTDGTVTVAPTLKGTRANNPGGGLAASASDLLLAWAPVPPR